MTAADDERNAQQVVDEIAKRTYAPNGTEPGDIAYDYTGINIAVMIFNQRDLT